MNAISKPTITAPCIIDMPDDVYHSDPCDTPSLSAGMITDLLSAPAKCRFNSKRLNPYWEPSEGAERFTIGSVSHILFLEPHLLYEKVVVLAYPDWRTKAAKEERAACELCGKTAILEHQMADIHAARAQLSADQFTAAAFQNGKAEQSVFWRHPTYSFWCRARPDYLPDSLAHVCDYKTTTNADPAEFGRHAYRLGYHRRAAWYLDGIREATGHEPRNYWFVNQEVKAPFLTSIIELDMNAIEAGRQENERACGIFARCLETNDWHGYRHPSDPTRNQAFRVSLPTYAMMQIEERNT